MNNMKYKWKRFKIDWKYGWRHYKLSFQIFCLHLSLRFFKWHEKRWNAYFNLKKWDKWCDAILVVRDMDKDMREIMLIGIPYKELEKAMEWKALEHVLTGKMV